MFNDASIIRNTQWNIKMRERKLIDKGISNKVVDQPVSTRTAQEAADSIGC
ncbi:hypothetical protein [Bacillus sp. SA1-12]|uniref:hypothetical protein n=1 Tax=Bacillus sp. SA1-12 TaxID=1455638 RepID=UPI000A50596F|nr:hypothetical protein [Bacillus sp. SA1-12]